MAEPSYEELRARVAELEKQKPGRRGGQLEFRVGEKGGVSVYGLGRFPVTLYYEQWVRLLDAAGDLRTFLEENKSEGKLKLKETKERDRLTAFSRSTLLHCGPKELVNTGLIALTFRFEPRQHVGRP
jgi:hypothetical protein